MLNLLIVIRHISTAFRWSGWLWMSARERPMNPLIQEITKKQLRDDILIFAQVTMSVFTPRSLKANVFSCSKALLSSVTVLAFQLLTPSVRSLTVSASNEPSRYTHHGSKDRSNPSRPSSSGKTHYYAHSAKQHVSAKASLIWKGRKRSFWSANQPV